MGNKNPSAVAALTAVILLFFLALVTSANELYNEHDKVMLLNSSNFKATLVGTRHAWIVQFFNSWCGHCIAFAPVWKTFASDVYNWRNIITVAAIDCSISSNDAICREYEVPAFPTIKFFYPNSSESDLGIPYRGTKSEEALRHGMIDFLGNISKIAQLQKESLFLPEQNSKITSLWEKVEPHVKVLIVVIEDNKSYIGKEVLLDVVEYPDVRVIRISPENAPLVKIMKVKKTPSIILLTRFIQQYNESGISRLLLMKSVTSLLNLSHGFDSNQEDLGGGDEGLGAGYEPLDETSSQSYIKQEAQSDQVYMEDLENAIYYSLMQEVPLHKEIKDEKLQALREYVDLLTMHFPGYLHIMKFLHKLNDWLKSQSEIVMNDYLQFVKTIQSSDIYLSPMQSWVTCKGSKPNLRGYPCSLWVLFHTLTVMNYRKRDDLAKFDPKLVIKTMTGYIKNFFSCSECSQHFQEMAVSYPIEIEEAGDGVLWLWRAHNKVNNRLQGAPSEDPLHPKLQFPSEKQCPSCRLPGDSKSKIQWSLSKVLDFLLSHYSHISVYNSSTDISSKQQENKADFSHDQIQQEGEHENSQVLLRNQRNINMHLNFEKLSDPLKEKEIHPRSLGSWGFSSLDMSLCVMLYVFSAVILLTVYFIVIVKRQLRRKLPFYSHKYPI